MNGYNGTQGTLSAVPWRIAALQKVSLNIFQKNDLFLFFLFYYLSIFGFVFNFLFFLHSKLNVEWPQFFNWNILFGVLWQFNTSIAFIYHFYWFCFSFFASPKLALSLMESNANQAHIKGQVGQGSREGICRISSRTTVLRICN